MAHRPFSGGHGRANSMYILLAKKKRKKNFFRSCIFQFSYASIPPGPPVPTFFRNHVQGCSPAAWWRVLSSNLNHVLELLMCNAKLFRSETPWRGKGQLAIGNDTMDDVMLYRFSPVWCTCDRGELLEQIPVWCWNWHLKSKCEWEEAKSTNDYWETCAGVGDFLSGHGVNQKREVGKGICSEYNVADVCDEENPMERSAQAKAYKLRSALVHRNARNIHCFKMTDGGKRAIDWICEQHTDLGASTDKKLDSAGGVSDVKGVTWSVERTTRRH